MIQHVHCYCILAYQMLFVSAKLDQYENEEISDDAELPTLKSKRNCVKISLKNNRNINILGNRILMRFEITLCSGQIGYNNQR